jgi:Polyketide cyclase / dehydrase and lipid transport
MSGTVHIEESVAISRSPADVWDAIADYTFDLRWRNGLLEMTPDPAGPADTVVTELDPGVSYRFEGSGTVGGLSGGRSVRPDPHRTGAEFTYTIDLQPWAEEGPPNAQGTARSLIAWAA